MLAAEIFHHGEHFIFTEKAARSVIARVFRAVEFVGCDDFERNLVFAGKRNCVGKLSARQAGRVCNDSQHVIIRYSAMTCWLSLQTLSAWQTQLRRQAECAPGWESLQ